ncbi:MAG: ice-binding family protein, partial [Gammaproteobacteria bacterium]
SSGATSVPTNQKINATFSKTMDPATITASGTFTVAAAGGATVPGTVSYAGSIATFTPTANLASNTQFTATITNAAKDLSGNALVSGAVPNPWSFTTGAGPDSASPTITLTNPANAQVNVLLNAAVSATFSKAMDAATITAPGTFTLAVSGVGGAAVAGNVTYDSVNNIATFTPAANLTASTQYTATITNAAKDLTGNALAAGTQPNPWTFTTGVSTGPTGPNLGAASTFGSFGGGSGITNQGINTVINGDIGTTGASTLVTGFHDAGPGCIYTETGSNVGTVNGNIYTAPPPPTVGCPSEGTAATFAIATQAASDALAAFNDLSPASRPGGTDPGAGQLGGLVLPPGTYEASGGSFLITGSDLTLDGQGDANSIWVFQMASTLTVGAPGAPRSIILINGAQAKNVYWQVGSAATINAAGGGTMVGTIIASAGVTFSTAGNAAITTLNGRALGLNASVTMVNTVINVPAP